MTHEQQGAPCAVQYAPRACAPPCLCAQGRQGSPGGHYDRDLRVLGEGAGQVVARRGRADRGHGGHGQGCRVLPTRQCARRSTRVACGFASSVRSPCSQPTMWWSGGHSPRLECLSAVHLPYWRSIGDLLAIYWRSLLAIYWRSYYL